MPKRTPAAGSGNRRCRFVAKYLAGTGIVPLAKSNFTGTWMVVYRNRFEYIMWLVPGTNGTGSYSELGVCWRKS